MSYDLHEMGIYRMTIDERIALVTAIWDTIVAEAQPLPLSEAKRQDLKRRLAKLDASPNDVVAWEEIDAEMTERFKP